MAALLVAAVTFLALVALWAYGVFTARQRRRFTATFASAGLVVLGLAPWTGIFTTSGLHWELEFLMALMGIPCALLGLSGFIIATAIRVKQSHSTEIF